MASHAVHSDKLSEHGDRPDDGYDAWFRAKVERGIAEAEAGKLIPADEVWRQLGLER